MLTVLRKGSAFGELALLHQENIRFATVMCETNVTFATLDKKNFDRSLKKV
jgi:hypothetical protein